MKKLRLVWAGMALMLTFAYILHAQEITPADSIVQLTAEAQGLNLVSPGDLPEAGTFWLVLTNGIAPDPAPLFDPGLPVYAITTNGEFLVDATDGQVDTEGQPSAAAALAAQAAAVVDLINQVQAAPSQPAAQSQRAGGLHALDEGGGFSPDFSLDTNGLYLQILSVRGGTANLILNNSTGEVYAILSKTDLGATNWTIEPQEVWPTNATAMPFTISELDRTNLFVLAQDWSTAMTNGLYCWWLWENFQSLDYTADTLDSQGVHTLGYDYTNGLDPNVISFSLFVTNDYVNSLNVPVAINLQYGLPAVMGVLVTTNDFSDDADPDEPYYAISNFVGVAWQPFNSNLVVSLNSGDGDYYLWVELKGAAPDATTSWATLKLTLDTLPPVLTATNPAGGAVSVPMIQLQGYVNETLSQLTFDVSNAAGIFTHQTGYWQPAFYDTNLLDFTTNSFQCYDVPLTNGLNQITLLATDLAGNVTTTNFSYTLSYAGVTNPPALSLVWPTNGTAIGGASFTLQAQVDDATATVRASITDTNGDTNSVAASVERNGTVWANNLPLGAGTNLVTLTATNAAGLVNTTNFNVVQSTVNLSVNPISDDQLNQSSVSVTGTVGDENENVTVNGVTAYYVDDFGDWEADAVPVSSTGTASLDVAVTDSSSNAVASQVSDQAQPAAVGLMSYAEHESGHVNGSCNLGGGPIPVYVNTEETANWTWAAGGIDQGYVIASANPCDNNPGENDFYDDALAGGEGGYGAAWVNGVFLTSRGQVAEAINTRVMIEPSGRALAGATTTYLVQARAWDYDGLVTGEPLAADTMQIDGVTLTDEGNGWGYMLLTAPAGATPEVTPTAPESTFQVQAQVVQLQSLTVVSNSATQIDATNWACVKSPTNDYVMMQAVFNITNNALLTNAASMIQWSGGEAVPGNPFQRWVSKTNSAETTVTASIGGTNLSLNVWVVWSTINFFTNGTNPSPLSFGGHFPDNQLGIETNSDGDEAVGKICAVATITPPNAYTVVSSNWAFPQFITIHSFENGISNGVSGAWLDMWTSDPTLITTNLDTNNKLYLIDAPNIGAIGGTNYEKYMNEMDYVTWNSQICSDTNNFWHWDGRWNGLQYPPPFITYTAFGTGTNTLPSTAFY